MKKVTRKQAERLAKNYPDALEVRDAAAILKYHPKSVQRIILRVELPVIMMGRKYIIAKDDLIEWMSELNLVKQCPCVDCDG